MKNFKWIFQGGLISIAAIFSSVAHAEGYAVIPDASTLKWQVDSTGLMYFRNLNDYNPQFLGCCYNYYLDTKTPAGKSVYAAILLRIAMAQSISVSVANPAVAGPINLITKE